VKEEASPRVRLERGEGCSSVADKELTRENKERKEGGREGENIKQD